MANDPKWGVFPKGDKVHVAPCDESGYTSHVLDETCYCFPRTMDELVIHRRVN